MDPTQSLSFILMSRGILLQHTLHYMQRWILWIYSFNILDGNLQAKISDFGLAKELPFLPAGQSYARVESGRGSRGYKADEYYDGKQIGCV